MLWTDIEDHHLYPDYADYAAEDPSIQLANESSTITPATPLTISDGPFSISSDRCPILEEDRDTVAETFEAMSDPDPDLDSELDSEPELPANVINRKVSYQGYYSSDSKYYEL